jgi:hypothetical protein
MTAKDLFKTSLLWIGAGSVTGMVAGAMLNDNIADKVPYSKEITGGALTVAGSVMMAKGSKNVKRIGTGVGSAGVSLLGTSLYNRVAGNNQAMPELTGQTVNV